MEINTNTSVGEIVKANFKTFSIVCIKKPLKKPANKKKPAKAKAKK